MLIAHVIESLEIGGAEAVVAALSRLHRAAGHAIEVHCTVNDGVIGEALKEDGIRVLVHGPGGRGAVMSKLFRSFRQSRPDVVHCHNKAATLRAAPVARLAGVRTVISTRHGMTVPPYRWRKELNFWVTAACCCDRVVAVCEAARANMRAGAGRAAHHVVTIHNGACAPPGPNGRELSSEGFTLVSVGRLVRAKDYATLLRSVALARRRVPDLSLWIVGDGEEREALRSLATALGLTRAVRLFGQRTDVGPYLRAADVFVLSSISEGLPVSLLEAMAVGLPAIVTEVGGMPEVIRMSGAGRAVPPRDPERLAAAIVNFAMARDRLEELGRRAARCYVERFTPERMAAEYARLYADGRSPHGSASA